MAVEPTAAVVATVVTLSCLAVLGWGLSKLVAAAERVERLFVDRDAEE